MPLIATPFSPPRGLRNAHAQTLLASTFTRKWPLQWQARQLQRNAQDVILQCSDGVRLHGLYNQHPTAPRGLAILLHGWEGSAQSSYQLSAALTLHRAGFDCFRLHLRDHGPSHGLNPELFNSTLLQEVIDAVKKIQRRYPHEKTFLAGHSLGGNFAMRIAARAHREGINLDRVVAVCPALNPLRTMEALESGNPIYHHYFLKKWKRSLAIKLTHYPELGYGDSLMTMRSLAQMNDFFVPQFTAFDNPTSYFNAYALTGETLSELQVPAHIILSEDDPIIPIEDARNLAQTDSLTIETTPYGGHCGFLMNWKLEGWIDRRLVELLTA